MNICRICKEAKSEDRFELIKASGNRRKVCRECIANRRKAKQDNDPEWKLTRAFTLLKWKYGISREQYELRLSEQGGSCAVCNDVVDYLLHVDHDHDCCEGRVTCGLCIRGLLCIQCNSAMGIMKDDPVRLRKAADYLERWRRQSVS